jgi:nicotinate-nucleotide--dimethylbenzimidazole phosphoribosyltransferase
MTLESSIAQRWDTRTKPQGSLGRLETLAADYCRIKQDPLPGMDALGLYLFAADHGVTDEGVSLYPSAVTAQMLANFVHGGAAVNVLARLHNVSVHIVDAGVGRGTHNFARRAAMEPEQLEAALASGQRRAQEAARLYDAVGIGEMGIGNSSSAAAILAALAGLTGGEVAGPGTGLSPQQVAHKGAVIDRALALHALDLDASHRAQPKEILRCVGGLEIAQMTGFLCEAARLRLPVMLDGFITGAAALLAQALHPASRGVMLFSHCSAEPSHQRMLQLLAAQPLLDLSLRLGEGSGAVLGLSLLRSAFYLYRDMASFASAGVSTATP